MARINQNIVTMTIQPADFSTALARPIAPSPTHCRRHIGAGRLARGERLPPQRDLAFRLAVTVGTVGRAYDLLAQRGLVRGEVGRGTYVLGKDRAVGGDEGGAAGDGLIDLTSNFPAPVAAQASLGDLLPMQEAGGRALADLLRYPDAAGMRHRAGSGGVAGASGHRRASPTASSSPTVPRGLWRTLLALARPGDAVLAEALCYSGLRTWPHGSASIWSRSRSTRTGSCPRRSPRRRGSGAPGC